MMTPCSGMRRRAHRLAVGALAALVSLGLPLRALSAQAATQSSAEAPYAFVVLGHVRGSTDGLNPKLGELLRKVRALNPAFAVLSGDMIWGDIESAPSRRATIVREWTALDSALATLQLPIYRVPGNHDINDIVSRDVYRERYGALPRAVTEHGARLLLLASPWIPADGDTRKMPVFRTTELDSAHVAFLRRETATPGAAHTFVFMQDLLWWSPDSAQWWKEIHPMLARGKVDAVFSGDLGPMKFSTTARDGVRYFQSSMETKPGVENLRAALSSRLLSSQFDNFLEVRVNGPAVDVIVHTLAEVSSEMFTPEMYRQVEVPMPPPPKVPDWKVFWELINSTKRLAALAVLLIGACFVVFRAGMAAGRRR